MSLASRLLTAVVGLGLIWFFWPFGGPREEVVKTIEPPSGHEGRLFTTPLPETKKPEPPADAQALPDAETAEAVDEEADDEVAAVAPEAGPDAGPKPKLKSIRYYRVTVRDGGTLETRGGSVISLAGIDALSADETCKDTKGKSWACGTRARAALTRFIRGRAVICKVPANGTAQAVTARCTLAGTDLSTWMVEQGWAKPEAPTDSDLAKAAEAAQKRKIGVWR